MADQCAAIRKKTANLEERVAELKGDIVGATGSLLHALAGQITLALNQLVRARKELATCEATAPPVVVQPPVVVNPPVGVPPVTGPPVPTEDQCLPIRMKIAAAEENVADLRDQMAEATGSVLHGLAGKLNGALQGLARARGELAACDQRFAGWAVLLCHWSDNSSEPQNRAFFDDLFTSSGAGSLNMTDYFTDCTHGRVDLDGTEVFGWFDMGVPRSAYVGNAAPNAQQLDRNGMLERAKSVARAEGVDLSQFFGVVVCFNTQTDLFGGPAGACCDLLSFEPSVIGQEMGHVYGLDHSRRDGSAADYMDRWDTMSTWGSTHRAPHPRWTSVGPGLNASNMRSMRWLDEKRVWRSVQTTFDRVVDLRPLHRRELPGFLAAQIPGPSNQTLLVEFRDANRWDAGIPEPTVLVHRFEGENSYIMHDAAGSDSLVAGKVFQYGVANGVSGSFGRIEVLSIDVPNRTARVSLRHRASVGILPERPDAEAAAPHATVVHEHGQAAVMHQHAHAAAPADPLLRILTNLAGQSSDGIQEGLTRAAVRRNALKQVVAWAQSELEATPKSPAPKMAAGRKYLARLRLRPRDEMTRFGSASLVQYCLPLLRRGETS